MARITVRKKVYWDDGWRQASGVVKQIMGDHAVVEASGGHHIVHVSKLSLAPMTHHASRASKTIISTGDNSRG